MKVLLLNPPREHLIHWTTGSWKLDLGEISSFPPLGLMYLASWLRKHSNHEVAILDAVAEKITYPELEKRIREFAPHIAGITATTFTFYDTLASAKLFKRINPDTHVCVGGSHANLFPEETMTHPEFDSLVKGDGEYAFAELVEYISNATVPSEVTGELWIRSAGKVIRISGKPVPRDINALPFPAYDLINPARYFSTFDNSRKMATICSSRGCPFQCTFCQVYNKVFRARTPENILKEMTNLFDSGFRDFYFFDDMFNITAKRVMEISDGIIASRMNGQIVWSFRGRADLLDAQVMKRAYQAGCRQIMLGVEDSTIEGLRLIKKRITLKQVKDVVDIARKIGIETSTNWILGFPHHRMPENIEHLIRTAIKMNSDYAQFSLLQLLPGCEMYDSAVQEGTLTPGRWREFVLHPTPDFWIELYTKHFSAEQLTDFYRQAHQRYYRRPLYILRRLLKLKSFAELKTKALAAMAIFRGKS